MMTIYSNLLFFTEIFGKEYRDNGRKRRKRKENATSNIRRKAVSGVCVFVSYEMCTQALCHGFTLPFNLDNAEVSRP